MIEPESIGDVLEEEIRVDHPKSVTSNEDFPQTNSNLNLNFNYR